ncbi:MAG: alkaline phosphatase [Desulfovermiculus sp.]|nr:alkaline phosphatase [Desulfovermiculus sp.]
MRSYWRSGLHAMFFLVIILLIPLTAWSGQAKYVFVFIGDGMGMPQRSAAQEYTGRNLLMNTFPAQGVTTTHAADRFITGSAAAGTAIACGQKTNIGFVGLDPRQEEVVSLAELAKEQGKKVGIISSVSIDHATPASFYAHVPARGQYYDIAVALAESGFDYFAGGGLKDPNNSAGNSREYKGNALDLIRNNGYAIVDNKQEFEQLRPGTGKVLTMNAWLQDGKALPYAMDQREQDISLSEFTAKGIELLDNENGFFIMVEGGKIDWACHANDGVAAIHDTLEFEKALQKAYDFYEQHPEETLILATGDHECGGMTLGFAGTKYATHFDVLSNQKVSFQKFSQEIIPEFQKQGQGFEQVQPVITEVFGLKFQGDPKDHMVLKPHEAKKIKKAYERSMAGSQERSDNEETYLLYGGYDPLSVTLTHILNQKAGIGWTSYKHTGVPVTTSAIGVGSERFNGAYDNTDLGLKVMEIMGFEPRVHYASDAQKILAGN